jgi:response regulator RpfG family c-di-GMP phosphodiesterase
LFLRNVSIAYENVMLRDEIEGTQKDMVYMLGEAIETRSRETGQHVRRVAEYCRLIALGMGLTEREAEILHIAAPLHDFGKIGIPDGILHHPGKLGTHEWEVMKTHASIGAELLGRSEREILRAAAIIAGDHHEKWDGSGYPNGKKGEEIHVYGRICALADVFDALGSKRCYKEAWPLNEILAYLREQRGSHFDPGMVDWMFDNIEQMKTVREQFPD